MHQLPWMPGVRAPPYNGPHRHNTRRRPRSAPGYQRQGVRTGSASYQKHEVRSSSRYALLRQCPQQPAVRAPPCRALHRNNARRRPRSAPGYQRQGVRAGGTCYQKHEVRSSSKYALLRQCQQPALHQLGWPCARLQGPAPQQCTLPATQCTCTGLPEAGGSRRRYLLPEARGT